MSNQSSQHGLAEATVDEVEADLHVISNDLSHVSDLTLTCICHNEMFFLRAFLDHYRLLGVGRFVVIDDASDDGSREFLSRQQDVMVLGSRFRFGDVLKSERIRPRRSNSAARRDDGVWRPRVGGVWRHYLLDRFCTGAWSVHVDLDEFLELPKGMSLPELATKLDPSEGRLVWAGMVDIYPRDVAQMRLQEIKGALDRSEHWFIDSRPLLKLRPDGSKPRQIHPDLKTRIEMTYLPSQAGGWTRTLRRWVGWHVFGRVPLLYGVTKPTLQYWTPGDRMTGWHGSNVSGRTDLLLPLLHFKFNGALFSKTRYALESGAYYRQSELYRANDVILRRMEERMATFLWRHSVRYEGFETLERTGNAIGLESRTLKSR